MQFGLKSAAAAKKSAIRARYIVYSLLQTPLRTVLARLLWRVEGGGQEICGSFVPQEDPAVLLTDTWSGVISS